jgi:GNAT superfamily N-acetyltransferase
MWWRLTKRQFDAQKGAKNKKAMKAIIDSGEIPGLLAYDGAEAVAWCSVAPREAFPRLDNARTLKRIDDRPVWSVVCFYIAPDYRRAGVSGQLLKAAIAHVKKHGGTIVEGYPFEVKKGAKPLPGAFLYTGLVPTFRKAGFKEALRRSASRPIMRYYIGK